MQKQTRKPKTARVTSLSVARLYNLGNYEHVRYEVTVEIPKGVKTRDVLCDTVSTLMLLKPLRAPFNYDAHKAVLKKPVESLSEVEKMNLDEWRQEVMDFEAAKTLRFEAIQRFDELGGVSRTGSGRKNNDDDVIF